MADAEWYETAGVQPCPNIEAATTAARTLAAGSDDVIEIYRVTRTLVRTVQRSVTIQEADVSPPA